MENINIVSFILIVTILLTALFLLSIEVIVQQRVNRILDIIFTELNEEE